MLTLRGGDGGRDYECNMQQETVRDRPSAGLRGGWVVWRTGQTPAAPSGREWQSSQSGEGATELGFLGASPSIG